MKKAAAKPANMPESLPFLHTVQGRTYVIEKQLSNGHWETHGQLIFDKYQIFFTQESVFNASYNTRTDMLHLDFGQVSYEGSCCLHFDDQQQEFSGNYQKSGLDITQIRGYVC